MTSQHVVVTGAAGYIGRHVVSALLDQGARVTAIVRPLSRRDVDSRAAVVEADVLAPGVDLVSLAGSADALVHLAWQDGFSHNAPSHIELLSSHFRFLRLAALGGTRRIAALGSMHEIGYWEGAIDADTPTNPTSLYGIAKDALRRALFQSLGDDVTLQWLRSYYIYGDDRNNRSIFTKLLEAADAGKSRFPFTSGKNRYDFIEIDELARQIATVSLQDEVRGIINCSSGTPVALGDKVEEFIASRNLGLTLEYGAFPDREYDSPAVWGDATTIRALMDR
ncbi:NAD-dependent epimerase/dehydratase family protein [Lacisediminihabitans sp.]|uniref:NAD-dependent epimerase/dehydratase family protein n=1 Tax=Lacisediminihabitans sp. TaxID=2787631 RepID=UPI00374D020A